MYVGDVLRVGVRAEPDNSQPAHGVVVSGMKLDVLEHKGGYIKVRSVKGVQGWIRDVYVTNDKPAKLKLVELQAEQAALQARVVEQDKRIKNESSKASSLEAELVQLKSSNRRLEARNSLVNNEIAHSKPVGFLLYALWIIMLVVVGFAIGYSWQRKQAMKQFGGLQV